MKKIILLFSLICCFAGTSLAGTENSIQDLIVKKLKLPARLKTEKMNEKVSVAFKVDNGKVAVVAVQTNNPELKKVVTEQLSKLDVPAPSEGSNNTYFIDIIFKVL